MRLTSCLRWTTSSSRSEEHTSELQSHLNLVCRLLLEKKKNTRRPDLHTYTLVQERTRSSPMSGSIMMCPPSFCFFFFFFNDTATTEIYTLSLHDALPISTTSSSSSTTLTCLTPRPCMLSCASRTRSEEHTSELQSHLNLVCRLLLEKKRTKYVAYEYIVTKRRPTRTTQN